MTTELSTYVGESDFADMRKSDSITPYLSLMQFGSKAVKNGDAVARTLMDMVQKRSVYDGKTPVKFIPIGFFLQWVRWNPVRTAEPKVLEQTIDFNHAMVRECEARTQVKNSEGKMVYSVTEVYNFLVACPTYTGNYSEVFILPFSKSNHIVGKSWLNRMKKLLGPDGKPLPMFMHAWEYSTAVQSKSGNEYVMPSIGAASKVDPQYYEALNAERLAFQENRKKFADAVAAQQVEDEDTKETNSELA